MTTKKLLGKRMHNCTSFFLDTILTSTLSSNWTKRKDVSPMSTPPPSSQSNHPYFIEAENAAEMARLMHQDRLLTKSMGGAFPEQLDLSNVNSVLDVACGPGGWILDVAHSYPRMNAVGIDISTIMTKYAQAQASNQGLSNARFQVMNALKPLEFPDNSFDLVNARLLVGFMTQASWPKLLQECWRITRPGGVICWTEGDQFGNSNGSAMQEITSKASHAMYLAGQTFSPDGQNFGITPVLSRLLHEAGYQNIQHRAEAIDYSAGTEAHSGWYQNFQVILKLLQPFIVKSGLTTAEEADRLYQQAMEEMRSDDFCGILYLLTAWGQKPDTSS